jgi:hypothetical protein
LLQSNGEKGEKNGRNHEKDEKNGVFALIRHKKRAKKGRKSWDNAA